MISIDCFDTVSFRVRRWKIKNHITAEKIGGSNPSPLTLWKPWYDLVLSRLFFMFTVLWKMFTVSWQIDWKCWCDSFLGGFVIWWRDVFTVFYWIKFTCPPHEKPQIKRSKFRTLAQKAVISLIFGDSVFFSFLKRNWVIHVVRIHPFKYFVWS